MRRRRLWRPFINAQFAARRPTRVVRGPNYHQPRADLRVRLSVVRPPLRGAGRLACRHGSRGRRLPRMRLGEGRTPALDRIRAAAARDDPESAPPTGGRAGSRPGRREGALQAAARGGEARRGEANRGKLMSDAESRRQALVKVYNEASVCERCPLSETRNRVVFGSGNADADLMFVGEAPGAEEDRQGLPFVGRAGGFLTQLLEGIRLKREDVFIANVLKCRPPGNRDPQPEEIDSCRPYLEKQVELIQPRVICTLGNFATKLLTANPTGITKVRGTPQEQMIGGRHVFMLPLFHPAAGLRTPRVAEQLREDFRQIPDLLAQPSPEPEPLVPDREPEPDQMGLFGG